jgi:hypothetical protein
MLKIKIFVKDPAAKGAAAKAIRPVLSSMGLGEILRRVETGEAVAEQQLYTANHDEAVATLGSLVAALQSSNVECRIVKVLSDVQLTKDGPIQCIESELTPEMLRQLFVQFEEIREEQQKLAELEDEMD